MRNALLTLLVAALVLPAAALASRAAPTTPGDLTMTGVSGYVMVQVARGTIVARVERGTIQIIDLTPEDRFTATINGQPVLRPSVTFRGRNIDFHLLGGSFNVQVRGVGISLSTRGQGWALLGGGGLSGLFSTAPDADCYVEPESCRPLPDVGQRIRIGGFQPPANERPPGAERTPSGMRLATP